MTEERLRLVRSAFAAWNRGDVAAFADHASEDVAWLEVDGRPEGEGAALHGRARLRRSLESLFEAWESYRLDVQRVELVDDRVVAVIREVARGRSSGVEIDSLWGYVITVEDGRMVRVEAYRDHQAALDATGLTD
jgi:ketosteroid isomerase-like protein